MEDVLKNELSTYLMDKYSMSNEDAERITELNFSLTKRLLNGNVRFQFIKADGTIREANGTLQADAIPEIKNKRATNFDVQTYFDTDKNEFRCFKKANLVGICQ